MSHCLMSLTIESPKISTVLLPRRFRLGWGGEVSLELLSDVEAVLSDVAIFIVSSQSHRFCNKLYLFVVSIGIADVGYMLCIAFFGTCHTFLLSAEIIGDVLLLLLP